MNRAEEIDKLHRDSEANRIAIRDLLRQQKKEFLSWLEANGDVLGFGVRQAQFYMLSDAKRLRMLEGRRLRSRAEAVHEEKKQQEKQIEARVEASIAAVSSRVLVKGQRALAEEFIDSGNRAMRKTYHPDVGGSVEQQMAVTAMRDTLLKLLDDPFHPARLAGAR